MKPIQDLVTAFADRLTEAIEAEAVEKARVNVLGALGLPVRRGPGRPRKEFAAFSSPSSGAPSTRPRKKAPPQLCPVPYCRNPAAPIFGMVCGKHKDVPKAKIKKYREARRAKKLGRQPATSVRRLR